MTKSQSNGKVVELVDHQARALAHTAIVRGAVTRNDLDRAEGRILRRMGRLEAVAIVQLVVTAIGFGVLFAMR